MRAGVISSPSFCLRRDEFVYQRVGRFFQKNSPRAEHSQRCDSDEQKHPDRLLPDAKSEPDDVGLVHEIQSIRKSSDEAEHPCGVRQARNEPSQAYYDEQTAGTGGQVDKNVGVTVAVKL